jgi:hypothetical protein
MLLKWKASAKTGEGIYILQSMILYRKVVLKVVLNRIVNLPDSGYLPDTRYLVDPDIRYSSSVHVIQNKQPTGPARRLATQQVIIYYFLVGAR